MGTPARYKTLRMLRIALSLLIMVANGVAVIYGHHTLLRDWQLVPAILAGAGEWLMLWAVVTALAGRVYCSTACPLGTLQDILARCRRRRHGYFFAPGRRTLRWTLLGVMAVAMLLPIGLLVAALDPTRAFADIAAPAGALVRPVAITAASGGVAALTLAVVAAFAVARGRLLCNTLCPVGTLLGAFSTMSLMQIDINTDVCVGCGKCTARCKAQCIDPGAHTVDFSRCVMCLDCMADCPTGAIDLRPRRHTLQTPMLQEK